MIKKLQIKFVIIIMSIMSVVLVGIFGAVNITMYNSTNKQTTDMLKKIADSDGLMKGFKPNMLNSPNDPPPDERREPIPQTNFSVKLDSVSNVIEIISDRNQSYTEDEISAFLEAALKSGNSYGSTGTLKYLIQQKSYGKIVVFLDNSIQASSAMRLFWITLIVGIVSLTVIFSVSLYLSRWAITPVKKAYEAQKRFVADASHELKTPLTVISANADVLSTELCDNKWLQFIMAETARMSELVNNLLYLAKSDASESVYSMEEFDLSNAVTGASLPFESLCYEANKMLTLDIDEDIICKGDEQKLCRVAIILLDNAVKHANENGKITVSLTQQGSKKIISVHNTGQGIASEDKTKLFDRFYRGDSSRARQTGGYGLGLSIAKAIVDGHKGKITVESEKDKGAKFTVILP